MSSLKNETSSLKNETDRNEVNFDFVLL